MTSAKAVLKFDDVVPNCDDAKILRQSSASIPDGPEPPLVSIAACSTMVSSIESEAMGVFFLTVLEK